MAAVFLGASITEASQIYTIESYPALQNNYTLTGTITTDGALGPISPSDITSVRIAIGPTPPGDLPWFLGYNFSGSLFATPTTLSAQVGTAQYFSAQGPCASSFEIGVLTESYTDTLAQLTNGREILWHTSSQSPYTDFVVATATPLPEPATLTLLGTALLGLGVVYLRRRAAKA